MTKKARDVLYSIILIAFSAAGIIYADVSINQKVVDYELARPDRYVQIWFGALLILALILLVRTIRRNDKAVASKMIYGTTVFSIVLFILFIVLIPYFGYTISSFIYLLIMTTYFSIKSVDRKLEKNELVKIIIKSILFSLVLAVGTALLFKRVLNVRLPDFLI